MFMNLDNFSSKLPKLLITSLSLALIVIEDNTLNNLVVFKIELDRIMIILES